MKKLQHLLIVMMMTAAITSDAQYVAIPDANFGTRLNTHGYSSCLTGNSGIGWNLDTTCSAVTTEDSITCRNANISNLSGIQYFRSLKVLICSDNRLITIPVLRTGCKYINCQYN